jgi:hypothetical protein
MPFREKKKANMHIHPLITAFIKPVTGCKIKQFPHGK